MGLEPLPVNVIASARRKKTIAARIVDGAIQVRVPATLTGLERDRQVNALVARLERSRTATQIDLAGRARMLARRYDLPEPAEIVWSPRQNMRWASCTPGDRRIRVSDRLASYPQWVVDYVIVHELAHLAEPNHSAEFHRLVARYPKAERAEGFLDAVSLGHAPSL